jgi:hypothetical protein
MAKQYQPDLALVASSFVEMGATLSLPDLIKDVSPHTRIIIANDASGAAAGQWTQRKNQAVCSSAARITDNLIHRDLEQAMPPGCSSIR